MRDLTDWAADAKHLIVICGGAVAGSEAAALCAERGAAAVVVEQNPRPYGKIEDGLPRWHDKLREREYERIDNNLDREGVLFVPCTRVGRDIPFGDLLDRWNAAAVVLASGAWRDRPLPVPGVDAFVGRGLLYQNAFVHWFNHAHEADYDGPRYQVEDGAIVVGGGLASVDVAKIINLTLYQRALAQRGIEIDVVELEHRGIAATLEAHGLSQEELGLRGATIYYRRRIEDMPVAFPRGDDEAARRKVERARNKLIGVLQDKFLVRVEPLHVPVGALTEAGRLVGLRFQRTRLRDGRVVPVEGSEYDVPAPLVISSIGSVPAPIDGVPMAGELIDFESEASGRVRGCERLFGLGNVLTGKGNIKDSRQNALEISQRVADAYLGTHTADGATGMGSVHAQAREQAGRVVDRAVSHPPAAPDQLAKAAEAIAARWRAVGYDGDYRRWVARD